MDKQSDRWYAETARHNKHWNDKEKVYLKKNYTKLSIDELMEDMGRTARSIHMAAYKLGISREKILVIDGTKKCSTCLKILPIGEFHLSSNNKVTGLRSDCKDCVRNQTYLRKYGITLKQYESMLKDQNHKCYICNNKRNGEIVFNIDHCHTTGKIRKILCNGCNRALGFFLDRSDWMRRGANYVEEYS